MYIKSEILIVVMMIHFCTLYSQNKNQLPVLVTQENTYHQRIKTHEKEVADTIWRPSWAVFLELAGKGFYSLNVDYRRNLKSSVSVGMQFIDKAFFPNVMYYRYFGKRKQLETGFGTSLVMTLSDTLFRGIALHGVIGYRYQQMNGFFFRAGFTPFLGIPFYNNGGKVTFVPLAGVSLGYSFSKRKDNQ